MSTIREFILYIVCRAENDALDVEATKKRITDGIRNGDFGLRRRNFLIALLNNGKYRNVIVDPKKIAFL